MSPPGEFTRTKDGSTAGSFPSTTTGIDTSADMTSTGVKDTQNGNFGSETASTTSAAAIIKDSDTGITYYHDPETGYYYYYDDASKQYKWYMG